MRINFISNFYIFTHTPNNPKSTAHACEFGYAPNLLATAENILDFVLS
jgi:hypothetical protein